jgi:hypothetical protein
MAQVAVVKPVKTVPVTVPGEGMAEVTRRSPQVVRSDAIGFADTGTVNVFEIPGNVLITNAWIHVTTDFDGSGSSAAPSATFAVPVATGAQIILSAAALSLVTTLGANASGPVCVTPASGGIATVAYTAGTTTAGQFEVYMEYVSLADRL